MTTEGVGVRRHLGLTDAETVRIDAALGGIRFISGYGATRAPADLGGVLDLVDRLAGSLRLISTLKADADRSLGMIKEDLEGFGRTLKRAMGEDL